MLRPKSATSARVTKYEGRPTPAPPVLEGFGPDGLCGTVSLRNLEVTQAVAFQKY